VLRSAAITPQAIATRLGQAGIDVTSCMRVEPSLEDVFLDVAERTAA
jgi:hypothetical protein